MVKETNKTLQPFFKQTTLPASVNPETIEREKLFPSDTETTFYGAAYNLLVALFQHEFAPTVAATNFRSDCKSENNIFEFKMIPFPDDRHCADELLGCLSKFKEKVRQISQDEELNITEHPTISPHPYGVVIETKSPTDLMDFLDNLAVPYKITLGFSFNQSAALVKSVEDDEPSFALSPLYSLEHVRALYNVLQGKYYLEANPGLQLSH
jgi:hypothetical protein